MPFEFFSATDPGRLRRNNEDSVAVDFDAALVVLADGMGGYNAGEIASGMATAFITSELSRWLGGVAIDRPFPLQSLLLSGEVFARQPLHDDAVDQRITDAIAAHGADIRPGFVSR